VNHLVHGPYVGRSTASIVAALIVVMLIYTAHHYLAKSERDKKPIDFYGLIGASLIPMAILALLIRELWKHRSG
jgi:hypothetical protein